MKRSAGAWRGFEPRTRASERKERNAFAGVHLRAWSVTLETVRKRQMAKSDGPQPSGCISVLSLGESIFSNALTIPGRRLSSKREGDLGH
jgi:hypothetical protein